MPLRPLLLLLLACASSAFTPPAVRTPRGLALVRASPPPQPAPCCRHVVHRRAALPCMQAPGMPTPGMPAPKFSPRGLGNLVIIGGFAVLGLLSLTMIWWTRRTED